MRITLKPRSRPNKYLIECNKDELDAFRALASFGGSVQDFVKMKFRDLGEHIVSTDGKPATVEQTLTAVWEETTDIYFPPKREKK